MSERFEKWAEENLMYGGDKWAAYAGWQAALSTRKPYGFGIVDKNGKPEGDCYIDKDIADEITDFLNEEFKKDAPHRVVELFYEDSES